MKKPEGMAEPGWYDDPEISGNERYWNGKFWEKATRKSGDETVSPIPLGDFRLGWFLFRYPLNRDKAFVSYSLILLLSLISGIASEFSSGTRANLIPYMAITLIPLMAAYIYLFFLPYLLIRRKRDKNKGISPAQKNQSGLKLSPKIFIGGAVGIIFLLIAIGSYTSSSESKIEYFTVKQKEISEILRNYNAEAAVAVGVVREVSDRTITTGDAIAKFGAATSKVTPILSQLREVCFEIDFPPAEGNDEEIAIAKAMNMLKVACEITPEQFVVLVDIFKSQIDAESTQADLDTLSAKLEALNRQKIVATKNGVEAILPYASDAEAKLLQSLLDSMD